jgi:hypothetical protein
VKLWGKIVSAFLLVMAALFAGVAVAVPEARPVSIGTSLALFAAAIFGVPALVRLFISFTGDEEVLRNGTPAWARVVSLQPTGWRYNRHYPIIRFGLHVELGSAVYPVEIKQAIEPEWFNRLAPGVQVGVRVDRSDRKNVVIDTRQPIRAGGMGTR